ncbi:MAG: 50S ribosomal protein L11 [archaeon]|nr:50S ribosomal protein L11 [archaeon]
MIIKLLVDGGEMKPGPIVGQKLGPIGINIGSVISEVNKATAEFKGTKVPVALDIDPKTKKFKVEVSSPPTSELLKKELGVESGSGDHKKNKVGNVSIETVIKIAKVKFSGMLAKEFKSAVKSVVGSCVSLGILVENKSGKDLERDIEKGVYDSEINSQKTETSAEKKAELNNFFENVLKEQENIKKAEEAAKAVEEAAKAAATPAPGAATPGTPAKPGEAAKTPAAAGKAAAPAKGKEEKKK